METPEIDTEVDPWIERGLDGGGYSIDERLDNGGVGAVHRATHWTLERLVVIKVLLEGLHPSFVTRFERKTTALATLRYLNIVAVVDSGVDQGLTCLAMELIERQTPFQRSHAGPLPKRSVVQLSLDEMRAARQQSKRPLEAHLGTSVMSFAYPHGMRHDEGAAAASIPTECGYGRCGLASRHQNRRTKFNSALLSGCLGHVPLLSGSISGARTVGRNCIVRTPVRTSFSEGSMSHGSSGTRRMRPGLASTGVVLSAREEEIVVWVAEGKTNAEISGILAISPFTVKNHVQSIIRKLGASNRTEAAVKFLQGALQQTRTKRLGPVASYADPSV